MGNVYRTLVLLSIVLIAVMGCINDEKIDQSDGEREFARVHELLSSYVTLPDHYQEKAFLQEAIRQLVTGDTSLEQHLESELRRINDMIEFDSLFLLSLNEPIFDCSQQDIHGDEYYRLIYFHELQGLVKVAGVKNVDSSWGAYYKEYQIQCESPGVTGIPIDSTCFKEIIRRSKALSSDEWRRFRDIIQNTGYWNINTNELGRSGCFDGANWRIDGYRNGYCKRISSHCPSEVDYTRIIGETLLKLVNAQQ